MRNWIFTLLFLLFLVVFFLLDNLFSNSQNQSLSSDNQYIGSTRQLSSFIKDNSSPFDDLDVDEDSKVIYISAEPHGTDKFDNLYYSSFHKLKLNRISNLNDLSVSLNFIYLNDKFETSEITFEVSSVVNFKDKDYLPEELSDILIIGNYYVIDGLFVDKENIRIKDQLCDIGENRIPDCNNRLDGFGKYPKTVNEILKIKSMNTSLIKSSEYLISVIREFKIKK